MGFGLYIDGVMGNGCAVNTALRVHSNDLMDFWGSLLSPRLLQIIFHGDVHAVRSPALSAGCVWC
jgi:hypothetical protein